MNAIINFTTNNKNKKCICDATFIIMDFNKNINQADKFMMLMRLYGKDGKMKRTRTRTTKVTTVMKRLRNLKAMV